MVGYECIEHGEKKLDREEFRNVAKPVVEWLQRNGCPHDKIIVGYGEAELFSGEMGFVVEVPD